MVISKTRRRRGRRPRTRRRRRSRQRGGAPLPATHDIEFFVGRAQPAKLDAVRAVMADGADMDLARFTQIYKIIHDLPENENVTVREIEDFIGNIARERTAAAANVAAQPLGGLGSALAPISHKVYRLSYTQPRGNKGPPELSLERVYKAPADKVPSGAVLWNILPQWQEIDQYFNIKHAAEKLGRYGGEYIVVERAPAAAKPAAAPPPHA